jgi:PAS domain S-box-containing protein
MNEPNPARIGTPLDVQEAWGLLLEQMPAIVWATNTNLEITYSQGAALAGLKLQPHQTVGLTLYEYLHTDDPESPHILMHRRALAGESVHKDAEWMGRFFQTRIEPLRKNGKIIGCIGVAHDITERKAAEAKLQEYAHRLLEVQEQERRHLALELHDEIGQLLTGLTFALDLSLDREHRERRLMEARTLVQELNARVRNLSLRLRPTMLDDLGLLPALLWLVEWFSTQTRVAVSFEHQGLSERFPPRVETAAYRIVQEALTNVARHAGVSRAVVRAWRGDRTLLLQVEDKGAGFDPDQLPSGPSSGLVGMRERACILGGHLEVESSPGQGTRLWAELPLPVQNSSPETQEKPHDDHPSCG